MACQSHCWHDVGTKTGLTFGMTVGMTVGMTLRTAYKVMSHRRSTNHAHAHSKYKSNRVCRGPGGGGEGALIDLPLPSVVLNGSIPGMTLEYTFDEYVGMPVGLPLA